MNGDVVVTVIIFLGAIIPILSVVVKINTTLTKLNITMAYVVEDRKQDKDRIDGIDCKLIDHDKRIYVLEKKEK